MLQILLYTVCASLQKLTRFHRFEFPPYKHLSAINFNLPSTIAKAPEHHFVFPAYNCHMSRLNFPPTIVEAPEHHFFCIPAP